MPTVGLVIPVYNGAYCLPETITLLTHALHSFPTLRIFFINDGSTDESLSLITDFANRHAGVTVLSYSDNQGKGYALKKGIQAYATTVDIIGFTDAEIPYGIEPITQVVKAFEQGADVVIGDRSQSDQGRQYSPYRRYANKIFRLFLPSAVRSIADTQSGFKFFTSNVAIDLFSVVQTQRWVFDLELLLAATRMNKTIVQLPVRMQEQPTGKGGVGVLKHGPQILRDIIQIHMYDRAGKYNI